MGSGPSIYPLSHPPRTSLTVAAMASSSQQGASSRQPAAPRAQGVERLPNELLTRILGTLRLRERCERGGRGPAAPPPLPLTTCRCSLLACRLRAALVCRRWHRCAHAPELCCEVKMEVYLDEGQEPWRLPSVCAWLARHGQHLQRLSLQLHNFGRARPAAQRLEQCMPAVAAAVPHLEQLLLTCGSCNVTWAEQLPASLRELGLRVMGQDLRISSSLGSLTQLTQLFLSANFIDVDQQVQLPPSIRTLALDGYNDAGLPPQARCSQLVALWSVLWMERGVQLAVMQPVAALSRCSAYHLV